MCKSHHWVTKSIHLALRHIYIFNAELVVFSFPFQTPSIAYNRFYSKNRVHRYFSCNKQPERKSRKCYRGISFLTSWTPSAQKISPIPRCLWRDRESRDWLHFAMMLCKMFLDGSDAVLFYVIMWNHIKCFWRVKSWSVPVVLKRECTQTFRGHLRVHSSLFHATLVDVDSTNFPVGFR